MTEIVKLINSIDTLFNVFVPGAICVWFYMKLSLKKIEYQGYLILSIAVGFVLKYTVDYLDRILPFVVVGFPIVLAIRSFRAACRCRILQSQELCLGSKNNGQHSWS